MSRWRGKLRLGLVLVIPFVLQLALVVGLTLWLSLRNGHQAVEEVASRLRSELDLRIRDYLTAYLEVPHQINELNADAMALGQLDPRNGRDLGRHFWHQLAEFDAVSFLYLWHSGRGFRGSGSDSRRHPGGRQHAERVRSRIGGGHTLRILHQR